MNGFINKLATEHKATMKDGDFITADGLITCGKCKMPKECKKEFPLNSGNIRIFPLRCQCDDLEETAYRDRIKRDKMQDYIKQLQRNGITDEKYLHSTFEKADERNPDILKFCNTYADNWAQYKSKNIGVLFYGDVGVGKTFFACCIANALIEKGVPVLTTNLSKLVKAETDKNIAAVNLNAFDLIVIDDLGVENATQTAYNIIDDIYRSNTPLIVTTNLTPSQLKEPDTEEKKRIYSRVLEMCGGVPILVKSNRNRIDIAHSKREIAKAIATNTNK